MRRLINVIVSSLLAFSWLAFIPIPAAHAAVDTCTWNGSASNLWSNGANWSGCDNGGVPEAGDTLIFPGGASNISMSNDLGAMVYNTVSVSGAGYTFSGNAVSVQNAFVLASANNTISSDIYITNAGSSTFQVNPGGTGNVINSNIVLGLTAGGDMNLDINADITHNGAITGSTDAFQMTGASTWITSTSAASTFTSNNVNIAAGHFQCRNDNCFGANANPVGNSSGGALQFSGANLSIANNITVSSSASPQVNLISGITTLTGTFTASTASGSVYVQPSAELFINGNITLNTNLYMLGGDTTAKAFLNGNIQAASIGNIEATTIFLGMAGANASYTGTITAHSGSVLEAFSSSSLGSTAVGTTIESGATLYADSTITVDAEPITVSGTGVGVGNYTGAIVSDMNTREYTGPITLAGDTTFRTIANGDLEFSGAIVGTGNLQIFTGGLTGEVSFTGSSANTYVGTTTTTNSNLGLYKTSGVVSIPGDLYITSTGSNLSQTLNNGGEQIADNANVVFSQNNDDKAVIQIAGTDTVGSIAGDGSITIIPGETFNVGNNNSSTTFAGKIYSQNIIPLGILNKIGTGTLTLSGATVAGFEPTYIVSGGVISVEGNLTGSNISVNSGAALKGTGTAGDATINSGGTYNAGNSPGCMTVASLTLTAGSNFDEELAGATACTQYDQTTVTGNANLNNATLNVLPSYTPTAGTVFTILQAGTITGQFAGLADGATFTSGGINFRINYNTSSIANHTVTLTVLGGTLAPTGQSSAGLNTIAILLILSASAGLLIAWRRKKIFQIK